MYYIIIINNENYAVVHFSIFDFVPRKLRAKCLVLSSVCISDIIYPLALNPGFYAYKMPWDLGNVPKPTQSIS